VVRVFDRSVATILELAAGALNPYKNYQIDRLQLRSLTAFSSNSVEAFNLSFGVQEINTVCSELRVKHGGPAFASLGYQCL